MEGSVMDSYVLYPIELLPRMRRCLNDDPEELGWMSVIQAIASRSLPLTSSTPLLIAVYVLHSKANCIEDLTYLE